MEFVDVSAVTVDSLVNELNWARLDFIKVRTGTALKINENVIRLFYHFLKVDVEGAEWGVFKGMQETLKLFPQLILVIEVRLCELRQ